MNIQIPNLTPGPYRLRVQVDHGPSTDEVWVDVVEAAPGLFIYGENRAVVQNEDYSINAPANPAAAGSLAVAYLTGQGPLDRTIRPGDPLPSTIVARAVLPVKVIVGGREAEVLFAGMTPGFAGLCQVNFRIPGLPPGEYLMSISFGGAVSNEAWITVR
jgi:uncharacterized protein (TIGR03437 family)